MAFLSSHPSSLCPCSSILDTCPAFLSKYVSIACPSKEASQPGGMEK